jgi:hypothetical protein
MIYFRLKRPAQVALIGAALAAPGCYGSHTEEEASDVPDARPDSDVRDNTCCEDPPVESWEILDARDTPREDFVVDDVPDSWDVPDVRDTEPDDFVEIGRAHV